jgi:hypothetical protein
MARHRSKLELELGIVETQITDYLLTLKLKLILSPYIFLITINHIHTSLLLLFSQCFEPVWKGVSCFLLSLSPGSGVNLRLRSETEI